MFVTRLRTTSACDNTQYLLLFLRCICVYADRGQWSANPSRLFQPLGVSHSLSEVVLACGSAHLILGTERSHSRDGDGVGESLPRLSTLNDPGVIGCHPKRSSLQTPKCRNRGDHRRSSQHNPVRLFRNNCHDHAPVYLQIQ